MGTLFGLGALGIHTWHMWWTLLMNSGTVLFGYARYSHVAEDRYSHLSRVTDMNGRATET